MTDREPVVLIVEDNALNRELLEAILEANGFAFLSVDNGPDALAAVRQETPDIVLMDLHMSGMDGYQTLSRMRSEAETASIPVVAITGNATTTDRDRMVQSGFDDIVIKPYGVDEILEVIPRVLSKGV